MSSVWIMYHSNRLW